MVNKNAGQFSIEKCQTLCDFDPTCFAIEVNGCLSSNSCTSWCWLALGSGKDITNGNCRTDGDQRAYRKRNLPSPPLSPVPPIHPFLKSLIGWCHTFSQPSWYVLLASRARLNCAFQAKTSCVRLGMTTSLATNPVGEIKLPADPLQTFYLSLPVQPCAAQIATAPPLNILPPQKSVTATMRGCLVKGASKTTLSAPTLTLQSQQLFLRASRRPRATRDGADSRAGRLMATPTAIGMAAPALTPQTHPTIGGRSTFSGSMPSTRLCAFLARAGH
jgi:hypothetical protein